MNFLSSKMTDFYQGLFYNIYGLITPPNFPLPQVGEFGLLLNGDLFVLTSDSPVVWVPLVDPQYATFLDQDTQITYLLTNGSQYQKTICGYEVNLIDAVFQPTSGDYVLDPPVSPDISPVIALLSGVYRCFFYQDGLWYEQPVLRFIFKNVETGITYLIDNTAPVVHEIINCDTLDLALNNRYVDCGVNNNTNPNSLIASNTKFYSMAVNIGLYDLSPQPDLPPYNIRYMVYNTNNIPTTAVFYSPGDDLWSIDANQISSYPVTVVMSGCNESGQVNVIYNLYNLAEGINTLIGGEPFEVLPNGLGNYFEVPDLLYYNNVISINIGDYIYFEGPYNSTSKVFYAQVINVLPGSPPYLQLLSPLGDLPVTDLAYPNNSPRTTPLYAIRKTSSVFNGQHVEGINSVAFGMGSHAEGSSISIGEFSHSQGLQTQSAGNFSHAEGQFTQSVGQGSHAEGFGTYASGSFSHVEGFGNNAFGDYTHVEGNNNIADGAYSHAEGLNNGVVGPYSHVEGTNNLVYGDSSHAEGNENIISGTGTNSHIEGSINLINSSSSHAQGTSNLVTGLSCHAEGYYNLAGGDIIPLLPTYYTAINTTTGRINYIMAPDDNDPFFSYQPSAVGDILYVPNVNNGQIMVLRVTDVSNPTSPIVESYTIPATTMPGINLTHTNMYALRKPSANVASNEVKYTHVQGRVSVASGLYSHAEGNSMSFGSHSHAEGTGLSSGLFTHAEGNLTQAVGDYSHVEGQYNWAMGFNSHLEGLFCSSANFVVNTLTGTYFTYIAPPTSSILNLSTTASIAIGDIVYIPNRSVGVSNIFIGIVVLISSPTAVRVLPLNTSAGNSVFPTSDRTTTIALPVIVKTSASISTTLSNHIQGFSSTSLGSYNHVEGNNMVNGTYNHVEGRSNILSSNTNNTHVQSRNNWLSGTITNSHVESSDTIISGSFTSSHIEGNNQTISGTIDNSHIEGRNITMTTGTNSHIEGDTNTISTTFISSHMEGNAITLSSGIWSFSHLEGSGHNGLSGGSIVNYDHIEGQNNIVSTSNYAHLEGGNNSCLNSYAHLEGRFCSTTNLSFQTVTGNYYTYNGGLATGTIFTINTPINVNAGDYVYLNNDPANNTSNVITVGVVSSTSSSPNSILIQAIAGGPTIPITTLNSATSQTITIRSRSATASQVGSHLEGFSGSILGNYTHVESNNQVIGDFSHGEGKANTLIGNNCHIEGNKNIINTGTWFGSHIEGADNKTNATGGTFNYVHVEGLNNTISGTHERSHIEGDQHLVTDNIYNSCHIEGFNCSPSAGTSNKQLNYCHIEGSQNKWGNGNNTSQSVTAIHLEGFNNTAFCNYPHVEGTANRISFGNDTCHIEGDQNDILTTVISQYNHVEGRLIKLTGTVSSTNSHWEGNGHTPTGGTYTDCHIEGNSNNIASGTYNRLHLEGSGNNIVSGTYQDTHIEGLGILMTNATNNTLIGTHIQGTQHTITSGSSNNTIRYSHIEGQNNKIGTGTNTTVDIDAVHVEGINNTISTNFSHVEGRDNRLSVNISAGGGANHVEGINNIITGATMNATHIMGRNHSISSGTFNNTLICGNTTLNSTASNTFNHSQFMGQGHSTSGANTFNNCAIFGNGNTLTGPDIEINNVFMAGNQIEVQASNCFCLGTRIQATNDGCVFLADADIDLGTSLSSLTSNCFSCRFNGGRSGNVAYNFYTDITYINGVYMLGGDNSWSSMSSRKVKDKVADIDFRDFLNKFEKIPLEYWQYKNSNGTVHNTPYVEDYNEIFGTNFTGLSTLQLDSINMGAIKGLCIKKNEMQAEIDNLKAQVTELQTANQRLTSQMEDILTRLDKLQV